MVLKTVVEKLSSFFFVAIEFLKDVLLENPNKAQVCLAVINWQVYLQNHTSPRLQMVRDKEQIINDQNKVVSLEELALKRIEFRVNYVQEIIQRLLSSWSGVDVGELDLNVGLSKYGIDSIAASNMKLRIKSNIGATFEVRTFFTLYVFCTFFRRVAI